LSGGILAVVGALLLMRLPVRSTLGALLGTSKERGVAPGNSEHERQDHERAERAQRACEATRSRVLRGASVGPTDSEGWVVEISLLGSAAQASPTWGNLNGFVQLDVGTDHGHVVWDGSTLSTLSGLTTAARVGQRRLPELEPVFLEQTITLTGEYVQPYFRERDRIELVRFAHALAKQQGAKLGALYARCVGSDTHHLGAWFAGADAGDASAALLFFMGVHSYPAQLERRVLSPQGGDALDPAFALSELLGATGDLDRRELASMIGGQDGMVAEAEGITSIRFPFVKSSSAMRASLAVARRLKLAPSHD
jgi:hypothetical protein